MSMSNNQNLNLMQKNKNFNSIYLPFANNCKITNQNLNFSNSKFQNLNLMENSSFGIGNKEVLNKFVHSNDFEFSFSENFNFLKKNNNNNFLRVNNNNNINNPQNEYSDLSYLNNQNQSSCNNIGIHQNSENANNSNMNLKAKKSIEMDFKIKYKTEKCKFWEINETCKFGDNVKNKNKINLSFIFI